MFGDIGTGPWSTMHEVLNPANGGDAGPCVAFLQARGPELFLVLGSLGWR